MSDTVVLCYHALSAGWPADLAVTPAAFTQQLRILDEAGYRGVTFSEAVLGRPIGKRVAVTFDDAFESVACIARPALDALGWPGTVYTVTRFAEDGAPLEWPGVEQWLRTEHAIELTGLGWPALRELADAGWEVGSHTVSHPRLTRIDDEALAGELSESRSAVEAALAAPCPSIAYPYGDVDARVVAAAGRAGYRTAGTLPRRWHRTEALHYPRVGVYHPDTLQRFRVKTARITREARGLLKR